MANQLTKNQPASTSNDSAEVERLREENEELRQKLQKAEGVPQGRSKPKRPSFGLSAGERAELEMHGQTTSPFTGETLTAEEEGVEHKPAALQKAKS